MKLKIIYVRYIVTNTDMTHANNYQYVKKWRENNRLKYLHVQTLRNVYNQRVKELYRIDPTLFL